MSDPQPPEVTAPAAVTTPVPLVLELDCGACGKRTLHQRRHDTGAMVCVLCRERAEMMAQPAAAAAPSSGWKLMPVLLTGGIVSAVSVFLPWLSIGPISRSGVDLTHEDGWVVFGLGVFAALLALDRRTGIIGRLGAVLFGVLIMLIAGHDLGQVRERVAALEDSPFAGAGSVGIGLYAALAGGALTAIGGALKR